MPAHDTSPRKTNRIKITRPMPTTRLCSTLWVVTWTSSVRWLKILRRIPLGSSLPLLSCSILSSTRWEVGSDLSYFLMSTMPSTTSLSPLRPTIPSRGW